LKALEISAQARSTDARQHFNDFCGRSHIEVRDVPAPSQDVTASWHEGEGPALKTILQHARHSDLVVIGRARKANGLPVDFIEELLVNCGRPVLIANSTARPKLTGTVMVCWKETPESARAMSAAMPYLTRADHVVVVGVAESEDPAGLMGGVARQLAWNGIRAETRVITRHGAAVPEALASAAQECNADLIVMGAYGRSRMRELLFGSCTQAVIRDADRPVLLMH
jgi:nucleotide-binding universal stress UspA family protein